MPMAKKSTLDQAKQTATTDNVVLPQDESLSPMLGNKSCRDQVFLAEMEKS